jgi:carbamoyltransferase
MVESNSSHNVWILGINSAYHEPAACLIHDGELVAAAEEERFNRVRHGKTADLLNPHWLPAQSIRFCLKSAGIHARDLTHIGYSFVPQKRLNYNVRLEEETEPGAAGTVEGEREFHRLLGLVPAELGRVLGEDVAARFHWIEHHLCHAASAFYVSPFEEAAILSADGIGESTSTWMGAGRGTDLVRLREIEYPNSLGLLWTKASRFLGFGEYGQWKVMGLAGYGDSGQFYPAFRKFVDFDAEGRFEVDPRRFQFRTPNCSGFEELFGPQRIAGDDIEDRHRDFAAALQRITNEALLALARFLHGRTGCRHLCQAGGVALNCIANRIILEEGPFDDVFIQPAANDAGTALGACYYIWNQLLGQPRCEPLSNVYLGPAFAGADSLGDQGEITNPGNLATQVAELLAGGEVVGWFQGRMEFGPRALGNRSFLADPRRADIVHYLNDQVKHREYFRPFAASVLDEKADEWFEFVKTSPSDAFMLYARPVRPERLGQIPAVTHIDNTCRVQRVRISANPQFHRLIRQFEQITGIPLLLNTSLNEQEPIVCSPEDAVASCRRAGVRYLAIGERLLDLDGAGPRERRGITQHAAHLGFNPAVLQQPVRIPFRSR